MDIKKTLEDSEPKTSPLRAPRRGSVRRLAKLKATNSVSTAVSPQALGRTTSTTAKSVKIKYAEPRKSQLKVYTKVNFDDQVETSLDSAPFTPKSRGASTYILPTIVITASVVLLTAIAWTFIRN